MKDKDPNPGPPPRPLTGAYYWVPIPPVHSLTWRILTCHQLGFGEHEGHPKIWPAVIPHLAETWRRDTRAMRRRLRRHCYGLYRGRVTCHENLYWINHGKDSPITDWRAAVVQAFNLHGRRFRTAFDDHERRLPDDAAALAEVLGEFLAPTDPRRAK